MPPTVASYIPRQESRARTQRLRRAARCCICRIELEKGAEVRWDPDTTTATCAGCRDGAGRIDLGDPATSAPLRDAPDLDLGAGPEVDEPPSFLRRLLHRAGPSESHGLLAAGALGQEQLSTALAKLKEDGIFGLHGRRLPGSAATLDHLVVTPARVWVLDAQRCRGLTELAVDGEPGPGQRLVVNGQRRTAELVRLQRHVERVRTSLRDAGVKEVPIRGALCFVDTKLRRGQPSFVARGHVVCQPRDLKQHLVEAGPFDGEDRLAILRLLARRFPPAE